MKAAAITNCRITLGIGKDGLAGIRDEIGAEKFMATLRARFPEAYATIFDELAQGIHAGTYRYPESYSMFVAAIEYEKSKHKLSIEETAAVHNRLRLRGDELAQTAAQSGE